MRILLITDNHTPTGGAEKVFFEQKTLLAKLPDVTVFSLGFTKEPSHQTDSITFKKTRNPWSKLWWQLFTHKSTYRGLKNAIDAFKPDIIHLHNIKEHSAALLKATQNYTVVQTLHDFSLICPTSHNIHRDLTPCKSGFSLRCILKHRHKHRFPVYVGLVVSHLRQHYRLKNQIKHFICVSPVLAEYTKKRFDIPVTFIPPFTLQPQSVIAQKETPPHFLYVGQLSTHKGVYPLLTEFKLATQTCNTIHLTLVGDGPDKEKLIQLTKNLGLSKHVTFTGWLHRPHPHYLTHRAVIIPSLCMESFGLTVTESMAFARPVIGSDRGALPWLIDDGITGCIFNPAIPGNLAEKIIDLATHPEKAKAMGEAGQRKLATFINNEATLLEIMNVYRSVIEKPSLTPAVAKMRESSKAT